MTSGKNIRIVSAGLREEESISALDRREGMSDSLYCTWSKEFLGAAHKRESTTSSSVAP